MTKKKYEEFIDAAKSTDEARPYLSEQTSNEIITASADGYRIHAIERSSPHYNKELDEQLKTASKVLGEMDVIAEIGLDADLLLDAIKMMTGYDTSAITLRIKENCIEVIGTITEDDDFRVPAYAVIMKLQNVRHSFSPNFNYPHFKRQDHGR